MVRIDQHQQATTDTMSTDKTTALRLLAAEQESADLLAQLEGCRAERDELRRKLALAREALISIEEYWNCSVNEKAMQDACEHNINLAGVTLAATAP